MVVLWRWLVTTGRSAWLTLAYAWNPLVVFEIAHSGHIDALGAMWIGRGGVLARPAPDPARVDRLCAGHRDQARAIVLAPLFLGRVRIRDAIVGVVFLVALYLPFYQDPTSPLGAVPNVVDRIRFNGPLFAGIACADVPKVRGRCRRRGGPVSRGVGPLAARRDRSGRLGVADGRAIACAPVSTRGTCCT